MKTEYTLIESFAEGGRTYVERDIDGTKVVLAEFYCDMTSHDAVNLRELVLEAQELADNADELHKQNQELEKLRAGNEALLAANRSLIEQRDEMCEETKVAHAASEALGEANLRLLGRLSRALSLLTEVDEDPQSQLSGTLSLDINAFLKEPK